MRVTGRLLSYEANAQVRLVEHSKKELIQVNTCIQPDKIQGCYPVKRTLDKHPEK